MANRRILVIDNQTELVKTVKSALASQGFDAERLELKEDSIYTIKTSQPEVVVIRAQGPDKKGLSLCTQAKKRGGRRLPVILITSSIDKSEIELHEKQRYHADLYLEESELSPDVLSAKIRSLVKKVLNNASNVDDNIEMDPQDLPSREQETNEMLTLVKNGDPGQSGDSNLEVEEPSWIQNLLDDIVADSSVDASVDSGEQKKSASKLLNDDWNNYNDLENRLIEQEREIALLKSQLEDARRQARSSPFSSDYQNLQEGSIQKEKEISILKEQLEARKQQIMASDERLKELAKRLLTSKAEIGELQAQERLAADRYAEAQTELSKLNRAFEEARVRYDSQLEKLKADNIEVLKTSEQNYIDEINSLKTQLSAVQAQADSIARDNMQQEIKQLSQDYESRIKDLQSSQAQEIRKLEDEKEASIQSIRNEYSEKMMSISQGHEAFIAEIRKNHAEEIQYFEKKIKALGADSGHRFEEVLQQHKEDVDKLKKHYEEEKNSLVERLKAQHREEKDLLKKEHKHRLKTLEEENLNKIEKLKSDMSIAHNRVDSEIEAMLSDHQAEFSRREKKHSKAIEELTQKLEEEKKDAEERIRKELSVEVARLKKVHAKEIDNLNKLVEKNQKSHELSINSLKDEYQEMLNKKDREHRDQIKSVKHKIQQGNQEILSKKLSDIRAERDQLEKNLDSAKKEYHAELEILKKNHQKELQAFDKKYKKDLHNLDIQYAAKIAELKEVGAFETEELKKQIKLQNQKVQEKLKSEQEKHEKTRHKLESQIARLLESQSRRAQA